MYEIPGLGILSGTSPEPLNYDQAFGRPARNGFLGMGGAAAVPVFGARTQSVCSDVPPEQLAVVQATRVGVRQESFTASYSTWKISSANCVSSTNASHIPIVVSRTVGAAWNSPNLFS